MINDNDKYGFRFREWDIYKDARMFRIETNKLLKTFPAEERYALIDQAKRALNSVILNIAEGAKDIGTRSPALSESAGSFSCTMGLYRKVNKIHFPIQ